MRLYIAIRHALAKPRQFSHCQIHIMCCPKMLLHFSLTCLLYAASCIRAEKHHDDLGMLGQPVPFQNLLTLIVLATCRSCQDFSSLRGRLLHGFLHLVIIKFFVHQAQLDITTLFQWKSLIKFHFISFFFIDQKWVWVGFSWS